MMIKSAPQWTGNASHIESAAMPLFVETMRAAPAPAGHLRVEHLPFTVRMVRTESDLLKAVSIRHAAYARHVPNLARSLKAPESLDYSSDAEVVLAESKLDGSPLGTLRIQTNRSHPLLLEESLQLPAWLQGRKLAEATRLGITDGIAGRLVKTVLFKVFYQYCLFNDLDWMVITARSPLDRQYERLMFKDVYPGLGYVPMKHVGDLPHRVLALAVHEAHPAWHAAHHPMLEFMCHTQHPDIQMAPPRRSLISELPSLS
jgi:hypothetical protein